MLIILGLISVGMLAGTVIGTTDGGEESVHDGEENVDEQTDYRNVNPDLLNNTDVTDIAVKPSAMSEEEIDDVVTASIEVGEEIREITGFNINSDKADTDRIRFLDGNGDPYLASDLIASGDAELTVSTYMSQENDTLILIDGQAVVVLKDVNIDTALSTSSWIANFS